MHDSGSTGNTSDVKNQSGDLRELLNRQIEQYRQMQQLEEELTGLIREKAFARIAENTKKKAALMEQIIAVDGKIAPLIRSQQADDGSVSDAETEKLRNQAIALVEKLQELETENHAALEGFRDTMTQNFRQAKQAKRAAHGYKQSKSIYRSKHDTRR